MIKILSLLLISFTLNSFAKTKVVSNKAHQFTHKKVKKGDSLNRILLQSQFPQKAINSIIVKNRDLKNLILSPKQVYTISKNSQLRTLAIYQEHSKKLLFWYNSKSKKFGLNKVNDGLTTELIKYSGKIHGSIYSSVVKKVKDPITPYKFQDIFLLYYDLKRDLLPGAKYSFVIEKKFQGKHFIKYGKIAEAELEIKNKLIRRVLVKNGKTYSYVGRENDSSRPFYSPVDYQHFTSLYKKRRFHPVRKRYMAHQGIDFGLPEGRSIYSVAPGKVLKAGYNRSAGHYIAIKHKNKYVSYYNHLTKRHRKLNVGSRVRAGDTIGWIGCSGSCTKPHLHFAVKKNGRFINPIRLVKSFPFKAREKVTKISKKFR